MKLFKVEHGMSIVWIVAKNIRDCISIIELYLTDINWDTVGITEMDGIVRISDSIRKLEY